MLIRNALIILAVLLLTGSMLVGATVMAHGSIATVQAMVAVPESQQGEPRNQGTSKRVVMEYAQLAKDAYLYAAPLLESYRALHAAIMEPSSPAYVGAFNTMQMTATVEGEFDQSVAVSAWLDLRTEPMLFHLPGNAAAGTRLELRDLRGQQLAEISSGDQEGAGANYLVVSAQYQGELPPGIERIIRSDTDLVQLRSFTRLHDALTFEQMKSWGKKIVLVPLSAYTMDVPPNTAIALKLPLWEQQKASTVQFIPYLNFMLRFIHAQGEELARIKSFQKIGIVEGLPRGPRHFGGAISAGIGWALEETAATATIRQI